MNVFMYSRLAVSYLIFENSQDLHICIIPLHVLHTILLRKGSILINELISYAL
jgi:hypothetical protein